MAVSTICFHSRILHHPVSLCVLLPDASPIKSVLYLLHGYSDGHASFIYNSALTRYCAEIPFAVVMPEAQCSFYMDTAYGQLYWKHISEEIPQMLRQWLKLDISHARSFVGGISMGGYGAAKLALQKPNQFAQAYLISPVTDIVEIFQHGFVREKDNGAPLLNKLHLNAILGNRQIYDTDDDLFFLLKHGCAVELPEFKIYTGTEHFMYKDILRFVRTLTEVGADCSLQTSSGGHGWRTWEPFIADMVARIAACIR